MSGGKEKKLLAYAVQEDTEGSGASSLQRRMPKPAELAPASLETATFIQSARGARNGLTNFRNGGGFLFPPTSTRAGTGFAQAAKGAFRTGKNSRANLTGPSMT